MQQLARNAIVAHQPGGSVLDDQPPPALARVDPSNGHIVALGSSATYGQTNFDYPVQAHRQPGSAFKVFALMTLIHDYDGDPNQTYYTSKPLPAGWLPSNPTWSVHTAEDTYQGTINITKATILSDNTVFAQLVVDLGPQKMDAIAHQMGITPARRTAGGGDRWPEIGVTPLEMADAYATLANGGYHIAPTIIDHVVFPDGSVDNSLGHPPKDQGLQLRGDVCGDPGAEGRDHAGHRHSCQLRLSCGRQDRDRGGLRQRLVRRVHAKAVNRRVGRLPAGQHHDGQRVRWDPCGADLARLHGERQ